jgi:hypothetical protein
VSPAREWEAASEHGGAAGGGQTGARRRDDRGKAAVHTAMVWGTVARGLGCLPAAQQKECKFERNKVIPLAQCYAELS